ncbi:hypothetical protein HDU98_006286 [Podochytrium sp. JEL0797]|nr:hypothetical protein HDU98_006286 [Podochytrium sp. JEL0797]
MTTKNNFLPASLESLGIRFDPLVRLSNVLKNEQKKILSTLTNWALIRLFGKVKRVPADHLVRLGLAPEVVKVGATLKHGKMLQWDVNSHVCIYFSTVGTVYPVCTCLDRKQIQEINAANDSILCHVLPYETIFFAFKSTGHSHIFTDLAYIVIKGDCSTSTRRWVERNEYYEQAITNVRFENAGAGVNTGGRDVVISFFNSRGHQEIDIWKNEIEVAHKFYKVLATLSQVQGKNKQLYALASAFTGKIVVEKGGDVADVVAETAEKLLERYSPRSYAKVFVELGC